MTLSRKRKRTNKLHHKISKSENKEKSYQSRSRNKKLKQDVEISRQVIENMSKKTPIIASSHGLKLLRRSKKNLSKGRPFKSAGEFLLATAILSASLNPYDPHHLAKKQNIAPDTQVHLDWHKGNIPDKKFTTKQLKNLKKRKLKSEKKGGSRHYKQITIRNKKNKKYNKTKKNGRR